MNRIKLVNSAWDWNNPDRPTYFSDDFQFTDELGSPPVGRDSWVGMGQLLKLAFPDISEAIEDIREEGEGVVLTGRFAGTFTNDLDLSAMGIGTIPATGKPVRFPASTVRVSFDGDKICKIHGLDTGPDAGMAGFLKALGVNMG